ncbi:MAG: rhomboid family intramembrane serine protease [Deltaproteobacteria bacterium]|nr:rhomboid family intramembrane serine protease [Deltaproteobacteria bacterium]
MSSDRLKEADQAFVDSLEYYVKHLELKPNPLLRNVAVRYAASLHGNEGNDLREQIDHPPPSSPMTDLRQEELDKKTSIWMKVLQKERSWQWGYIPNQSDPVRLVTHMFLHGGFLHLFFNMLFLYIMAPFIEDQWGRPLFLCFYLAAGVVAALMFAWHKPDAGVPLVGASGAIAGVMGAFLVRFPTAKIKFWRMFPPGTFNAYAWIVLPLWFIGELMRARLTSIGMPSGGDTVAYWAHVYGFGFGVAAGLLMWALNVEERYVKPAIESQIYGSSPTLSQINRLLVRGRRSEACDILERELLHSPSNLDAALSYWPIAAELGRMPERRALCQRAIAAALRAGKDTEALELWVTFQSKVPRGPLDLVLAVPLSHCLQGCGRPQEAAEVIERAADSMGADVDPELLVEYGNCAVELKAYGVDKVVDRIVEHVLAHPRVSRAAKQAFNRPPRSIEETSAVGILIHQ